MKVVIKESIKTAKTVDAALREACEELGIALSDDGVQHEIIDMPAKGFLGFGSHPAKVRVYIEEEEKAAVNKEEIAVSYIKDVLTAMGAENFSVNAVKEGENLNITLEGEDLGFVIGRRGETIDAIQYLTGLVVNRIDGDYLRVTIDSGNFREKREKTLESLARRLAKTVVKTGRSITLEPMNPYERRIIHFTVSTVEGATSSSIGEEPNRRVVISSTNPKKAPSRDGRRKNYNRDNRESGRSGNEHRSGDKPYRKNNNRNGGKKVFNRKDRTPINNEVDTTPVTDVLPKDAESKPLYSKIEL
ncbi:MAG: RNA-binding cell elongation regulator Jag/EloR [Negativibacillus sp.]